jgi:HSP20 family protein
MEFPATRRTESQREQRARQPGAALVRRGDPYREMEDFYDRLGRMWQSFFGESDLPGLGFRGGRTSPWSALADIEETDDAFVVDLDLPGVRADDIRLELRDNDLHISGDHREKERVGVLRRQTRRAGEFEYVVSVPGDVDPDKVEATLHDGVLTVQLGKAATARPRRIEIKSS